MAEIHLGDSAIDFDSNAFLNCNALKSVYIDNLKAWCGCSFDGVEANPLCGSEALYVDGVLTEDIQIPETAAEINGCVFAGCTGIRNVKIPKSVTTIGAAAFRDCTELQSVSIPDGVNTIEESAFYNCASLSQITLPESLEILDTDTS